MLRTRKRELALTLDHDKCRRGRALSPGTRWLNAVFMRPSHLAESIAEILIVTYRDFQKKKFGSYCMTHVAAVIAFKLQHKT